MKLVVASIVVLIALIASISCVSIYNSNHQEEIIPPCYLSYSVSGEALIGDQYIEVSSTQPNRSKSTLDLIYPDGKSIYSSLSISLEFANYISYDSYDLAIDKHSQIPLGSEKLDESRLLTEEDKKLIRMPTISEIYYLEINGAEFEFHMNNTLLPIIVCNYTSFVFDSNSNKTMAKIHLVLDIAIGGWNMGIPVDGKPVGPWAYDMINTYDDSSKAVLNINCVSSLRTNNSGGYLIAEDKASKYCSISLTGDHDLDPIFIKFYQSGTMDVSPTIVYDEVNNTSLRYYTYNEKIGHMDNDNQYVYGTITLSSTIDSEDPPNGNITSLKFSYSICTLTYDSQGNITSESTISSEYEAVL